MRSIWQDVRHGFRSLAKNSGLTAVIIVTLALGVGANTAIFSVVYGVLLRPLPYPQPDRIIQLSITYNGQPDYSGFDAREFDFWKAHSKTLQFIAATTPVGFNLSSGSQPLRIRALRVSRDYFRVMGVLPVMGREFSPDEDSLSGPNVAILSYALWKSQFGGDASLIGKTISLDRTPFTVVGIMPSGFQAIPPVDLWTTIGQVSQSLGNGINYTIIGRLHAGVSRKQADAYLNSVQDLFYSQFRRRTYAQHKQAIAIRATPLRSMISLNYHTPLLVLFGAIGLVLLIACANVANLLMARAAIRSREIAIRTALGASRLRVFRQLLTESLLLALFGGSVGLFFADWGLNFLLALAPADLPRVRDISIDGWVLGFTLVASLLTGVLFGMAPAFQSTKVDLNNSLKESVGRATSGTSRRQLGNALAIAEIALSLILLMGAALLIETFSNLLDTNPGFDPHPILVAQTWTTGQKFASSASNSSFFHKQFDSSEISNFYQRILDKVRSIPGVESAAVVGGGLPLDDGGNVGVWLASEGKSKAFSADFRSVTPDYFRTFRVPLLQGRLFSQADSPAAANVAIINATFLREEFSQRDPIGQNIYVDGTPREIVGVVGDVKSFLDQSDVSGGFQVPSTVFIPLAQDHSGESQEFQTWFPVAIVVRTAQPPLSLSHELEAAVHSADPNLPIGRIQSMDQVLFTSLSFQKFLMTLMSVFAGLALVLATVGVYGVMAYSVSQRTHEIGIRMALGARSRDVLRMIVGQGMLLASIGLAAGLVGAFALTRLLAGELFGVKPTDPATFAFVIIMLTLIALMACYVPARRASQVDPLVALRHE